MNYYEELGLAPSATTEEIRQAYKNLARLLHPDQHQDEKLRELAERQMKRLNDIVAVLTDPLQRQSYDRDLEAGRPPVIVVAPPAPRSFGLPRFLTGGNLIWAFIALIGAASLLFFLTTGGGRNFSPQPRPAPNEHSAGTPPLSGQSPDSSLHPPPSRTTSRSPSPQPETPQPQPPLDQPADLSPSRTEPDLPPPVLTAATPVPAVPKPETPLEQPLSAPLPDLSNSFAGNWFYAPAKEAAPSDLYPPEYIELRITEEAGLMRGRYRARYRVTDRPVSPEVFFQFQGPVSPKNAQLGWAAPGGGAKGEVQLKLLSPNSIEVNWWTIQPGKNMGLASGTAVLIRQQEPRD